MTEKTTISYCLNGLDRQVWLAAKLKAKSEGMTMRGLLHKMLKEYTAC